MADFDEKSLFPDVPRVIYGNSPLVDVICQLRFPTILKIDSGPPAEFQERIRHAFPLFEQRRVTSALPPEIAALIAKQVPQLPEDGRTESRFLTEDRNWTLTLTRDFLSIQTPSYQRWEDFWGKLSGPLLALMEIYKPAFFQRLGIRYVDVIDRSNIGQQGVSWRELIAAHVLGELSQPAVEMCAQESLRQLRLSFPGDKGGFLMQHGFGRSEDNVVYFFDFDSYSSSRTEANNVEAELVQIRKRAWRAFRWAITNRLHEALRPTPI